MTSRLAAFVEAHGRALVLIVASFATAGLIFLFRLPVSLFPQTDFPRIVILVDNGIAPVNVQMIKVTRPIEEAIRIVPGITNVRSVTSRGSSEISVFFRWDVDILHALHQVQGRIAQILPTLPPESRFYVNRLTFSVFPMIGFSIASPKRSLSELWELAYYNLAPPVCIGCRAWRKRASWVGGGRNTTCWWSRAGSVPTGSLSPAWWTASATAIWWRRQEWFRRTTACT